MSNPSSIVPDAAVGVHNQSAADDAIVAFLAVVQPEPHPDERIELRYRAPADECMQRQWYVARTAFADAARQLSEHSHVYYGVALRRGDGQGTAADCTRVGALWADTDAKLWAEGDATRVVGPGPLAAARAAIEAFALQASALLCSGGGWQPYWRLAVPADVRDERTKARVEHLNKALARAVCGPERTPDHVHDVARILRVPDTLNHKTLPPRPVQVVWLHPEIVYTIEGITATLEQYAPWALRAADDAADGATQQRPQHHWTEPDASADELRALAARGRIRRTTLALLDEPGAATYESPSEADAAIAAGLLHAGLTLDEALAVILASPRGDDAFDQERKGNRHALKYWQRTLQHAANLVGPVSVRADGRRVRPVCLPAHRPFTSVRSYGGREGRTT